MLGSSLLSIIEFLFLPFFFHCDSDPCHDYGSPTEGDQVPIGTVC